MVVLRLLLFTLICKVHIRCAKYYQSTARFYSVPYQNKPISSIASHLLLFLNQLATISTDTHTLSREIYNALNFIYDHIESDISIDDLAKCSMLSVPQFKVRFKQEVGISPRSFINMQKIELAKQMLLEGSSKTQIALSLGFNTSSYFSAVFKRYTFCTPSEYVKKHRS